jgi:thiosulfate/3-mercaptopyruvate sulfurtransferase
MTFLLRITIVAVLLGLTCASITRLDAQQPSAPPAPSGNATIPATALLQPDELLSMLQSQEKPLVLQVGSHVLYAEAHIPGSEYVEATGKSPGIEALRKRVASLGREQLIVIYCGCCPWGRCPNIRPAYDQLHAMGFTHVKALYIADNFGKDWVDKGYPIEKGR